MKIAIIIAELSPGIHKGRCPALPGCVVVGRTRQEVAERLPGAIASYLASLDSLVPKSIELELADDPPLMAAALGRPVATRKLRRAAMS